MLCSCSYYSALTSPAKKALPLCIGIQRGKPWLHIHSMVSGAHCKQLTPHTIQQIEEEATSGSPFHLICMYSSWGSPLPFPHKSVCFPYFLLVFYGWWGSSLIHLDSRWIHCTFPGSCLVTGKKKEEKKASDKESMQGRSSVKCRVEKDRMENISFSFSFCFHAPSFPSPWV